MKQLILLLGVVLLASCQHSKTSPTDTLTNTAWQLVAIESMDDQRFTPEKAANYTLAFQPEGKLQIQAGCNKGFGSWQAEAAAGLTLNGIALTRMACPPPSIANRYTKDLSFVRSYIRRDGHLYLATFADGAILKFEPLPAN